jgi:hypothetical protein
VPLPAASTTIARSLGAMTGSSLKGIATVCKVAFCQHDAKSLWNYVLDKPT